jgi:hypothetical protein
VRDRDTRRARTRTAAWRGAACASDSSAQQRGLDGGRTAPGSSRSAAASGAAIATRQRGQPDAVRAQQRNTAVAAISDARAPGDCARPSHGLNRLSTKFKASPKPDAARSELNHHDYAKGEVLDYYRGAANLGQGELERETAANQVGTAN